MSKLSLHAFLSSINLILWLSKEIRSEWKHGVRSAELYFWRCYSFLICQQEQLERIMSANRLSENVYVIASAWLLSPQLHIETRVPCVFLGCNFVGYLRQEIFSPLKLFCTLVPISFWNRGMCEILFETVTLCFSILIELTLVIFSVITCLYKRNFFTKSFF